MCAGTPLVCPRSRQLKPSFNKSGQKSSTTPQKAPYAAKAASENNGPASWQRSLRHPFPPRRTAATVSQGPSPNSAPSGVSSWPRRSTPIGLNCIICAARGRPGAPSTSTVRTVPDRTLSAKTQSGRLRAPRLRATMAFPLTAHSRRHPRHERTSQ